MPRSVRVNSGPSRYLQIISVGPHVLQADEPSDSGGNDAGPNPYELLLAALGACTSMTVRMYAERKQWPLKGVQVSLSYARVHAEDCAECDTKVGMVDRIEVGISFTGKIIGVGSFFLEKRTDTNNVHLEWMIDFNTFSSLLMLLLFSRGS